ncbi:hypothetical protein C8R46DRAFT_1358389 [Mycena filopes]|nr:hypothetical protein C8R46DRAFT_1358389 [Mycena filopes]
MLALFVGSRPSTTVHTATDVLIRSSTARRSRGASSGDAHLVRRGMWAPWVLGLVVCVFVVVLGTHSPVAPVRFSAFDHPRRRGTRRPHGNPPEPIAVLASIVQVLQALHRETRFLFANSYDLIPAGQQALRPHPIPPLCFGLPLASTHAAKAPDARTATHPSP